MAKRFDHKTARILHLLGKNKCLDDLIVYEPDEPEELVKWRKLCESLGGFEKMTPADQIATHLARKRHKDYFDEARAVLSPDLILCQQEWEDRIVSGEEAWPLFKSQLKTLTSTRPKAYYLTSSTAKAVLDNHDHLFKRFQKLTLDLPTESGLLMLDKVEGRDWSYIHLAYQISPEGITALELVYIEDDEEGDKINQYMIGNAFHMNFVEDLNRVLGGTDMDGDGGDLFAFCMMALLFIYFFEVEKEVTSADANPKRYSQVKLAGEKYESQVPYPINIVDATWFTTLVKTDPFLCSGHWRNQPYGPGRGQYKIIWIKAYQKNGYTRKAKNKS